MKKKFAVTLSFVVFLCLISGCGGNKYVGEVNVYNWGENIDESIFSVFEKETGIKVNYSTYTSNEMLYSTLQTGGTSYDVIIPSDYLISRLISEDMLEKIDFSNIPNYDLLDDSFKKLEYDPSGEYSVAYTWGTVGLIYNKSIIPEPITSWSAVFDEKYADQILMFDNSRDAMMIALRYLGYSVNTTDKQELENAFNLLVQQRPILQGYVMDQIYDKLESGEAAIGPYYAGDYLSMLENNENLVYVFPDEGTNWFVDAMCIPKGAENKENAEKFINFMCGTEICLENMSVTCYASPNMDATTKFAADLDDYQRSVFLPNNDVLENCEVYINLPQDTLELYNDFWVKLKS